MPDVGLCFRLLWVIRESRHLFVPGCDSLALGPCESRGVKMGGGPPGSHSWLALPGALLEGWAETRSRGPGPRFVWPREPDPLVFSERAFAF